MAPDRRARRFFIRTFISAGLILALAPAAAPGMAVNSYTIGGLHLLGLDAFGARENNSLRVQTDPGTMIYRVTDAAGVVPVAASPCSTVSPTVIDCTTVPPGALVDIFKVALGRGDDVAVLNTVSGAFGPVVAGSVNVFAGFGDDSVTGQPGSEGLSGGNGDDKLSGLAGADGLYGRAGNDRLLGGAGADSLDGGAGADTLVGGPGAESWIAAGPGRDILRLVDRNRETGRCGPGIDLAVVDRFDVLLAGCEVVIRR